MCSLQGCNLCSALWQRTFTVLSSSYLSPMAIPCLLSAWQWVYQYMLLISSWPKKTPEHLCSATLCLYWKKIIRFSSLWQSSLVSVCGPLEQIATIFFVQVDSSGPCGSCYRSHGPLHGRRDFPGTSIGTDNGHPYRVLGCWIRRGIHLC